MHPSSVRMIRSPIWSSICSLESIFIVFCIFEQGPWQCNNFSRHQTKYWRHSPQLLKPMFTRTPPHNFFSNVTCNLWDLQQLIYLSVSNGSDFRSLDSRTLCQLCYPTVVRCLTSPFFTGLNPFIYLALASYFIVSLCRSTYPTPSLQEDCVPKS